MSSLRNQVLQLYKNIIRLSNRWIAGETKFQKQEQAYIKNEARYLFRINKNVLVSFDKLFYSIRIA